MGFGLKVTGKYDNGNDDWLAHDGNKNEWAIAYHGVRANKLEQAVGNIFKGGFDSCNILYADFLGFAIFGSSFGIKSGPTELVLNLFE